MYYFWSGEMRITMTKTLSRQLLEDLDALFTKIVTRNSKEGIVMTRWDICELISRSPAPRLYISPERAIRLTYGFDKYSARHYHAGAHREFQRRYLALPENMRSPMNIQKILEEPAPSFYLSPYRIYKLLYKIYDRRK